MKLKAIRAKSVGRLEKLINEYLNGRNYIYDIQILKKDGYFVCFIFH